MTVFARNDVLCVSLSRSHGGCGHSHSRPVVNGAPVKLWAFTNEDCAACERALHADPLWSATISQLPETHDEQLQREDEEKRGQRDLASTQVQALTQIASLPDAFRDAMVQFAQVLTSGQAAIPQLTTSGGQILPAQVFERCPSGHEVTLGAKFCGECGDRVQRGRAVEDVHPVVELLSTPEEARDAVAAVEDTPPSNREYLEGLSFAELKDYARQLGVKPARSREDTLRAALDHLGE